MSEVQITPSKAVLNELLDRLITIVQGIQDAVDSMPGVSARLKSYGEQFDNLITTLWLIQNEPALHLVPIQKQSELLVDLAKGLQDQLEQNRAVLYNPRLIRVEREDQNIDDSITQLEQAEKDLKLRVVQANVGISGSMHSGFMANASIVQRVDEKVQSVLKERPAIAYRLEQRGIAPDVNGQIRVTTEDAHALGLMEKASWLRNESCGHSNMFNSDLREREIQNPLERLYQLNISRDMSLMVSGLANAEAIAVVMRIRPE